MMFNALRAAVRIDARVPLRRFSCATPAFNVTAGSKVWVSAADAVRDMRSGSTVLVGGFGLCGTPETLIRAASEHPELRDLAVVSNNMGTPGKALGTSTLTRHARRTAESVQGILLVCRR